MKKYSCLLLIIIGFISIISCSKVGNIVSDFQKMNELPPKKSESQTINYQKYSIESTSLKEVTKGKIKITLVAAPFSNEKQTSYCYKQLDYGFGGFVFSKFLEKEIVSYPSPYALALTGMIHNGLSNVIRLDGFLLKVKVDGVDTPFSHVINNTIAPNENQIISILLYDLSRFKNGSVLSISLFDIPIEMNKSGTVTKKDSFSWSFIFKSQSASSQEMITTQGVEIIPEAAMDSKINIQFAKPMDPGGTRQGSIIGYVYDPQKEAIREYQVGEPYPTGHNKKETCVAGKIKYYDPKTDDLHGYLIYSPIKKRTWEDFYFKVNSYPRYK